MLVLVVLVAVVLVMVAVMVVVIVVVATQESAVEMHIEDLKLSECTVNSK